MEDKLIIFQGKNVRRKWFNEEWWFSVVDIIKILTETERPRKYWSDLKKKLIDEGFEVSEKIGQLKLEASDGKIRITDCAPTNTAFRLIQSIPSKRAEPFKQWLAQIGYERVQEIENPELAQKRMKSLYEAKGYSKSWIEKRVRGIAIRDDLTDEWDERGIKETRDFAILTAEISKATFGMTPSEYKKHKHLPVKSNTNLRDHMNDFELIFNMLGEKTTTEITKERNSLGFEECKDSAKEGGEAAKDARESVERRLGKSTISKSNYLTEAEKKKRLK